MTQLPSDDPVLKSMATELRGALLAAGLDPTDPPQDSRPPTTAAWTEYQRRGGGQYDDPDDFITALVLEAGR